MARSIGNELPAAIVSLLAADPLPDQADADGLDLTILVLTTTPDGWPHLAMVSLGEIIAVGPRALRLALWPNSTAARNLWREQRMTLALVHDEAAYSVRCAARRGADLVLPANGGQLACFGLRVDDVVEDVPPDATLTGGVRFRLHNPDTTMRRWQQTRAALRAARFSGG